MDVSFRLKHCYKCKEYKNPVRDFCSDATRRDGRNATCRKCASVKTSKTDYYKKYHRHQAKNIERQIIQRMKPKVRLAGLICQAKKRAKQKKLDFDIDIQWALGQYKIQQGKCLLTGIPFVLESFPELKRKRNNPYSVSIDRIDSDKGYTKTNCRLVCVIVNYGLNRFGDAAFEYACRKFIKRIDERI